MLYVVLYSEWLQWLAHDWCHYQPGGSGYSPESNNRNSITTASMKLIYCCYFLLPDVLVMPGSSQQTAGSSQQTAGSPLMTGHYNRWRTSGSSGRVLGWDAEGCWFNPTDDRVWISRSLKEDLKQRNRRWLCLWGRPHPWSIPPFNSPLQQWIFRQTHPSWCGEKIRHDAAVLKEGPTLLTVAFSPSR